MLIRTLTLLFILFSFGCSQQVPKTDIKPTVTDKIQTAIQAAKKQETQGDYKKAAQTYLQIAAQTNPPTQQGYQLSAIKAFLKAEQFKEAKAQLATLDVSQSFGLEIPMELVHIQIDLVEKRPTKAWKRLQAIESSALSEPSLQMEYKQLHAEALAAKGNLSEAMREWMELSKSAVSDPVVLRENHKSLWRGLSSHKESNLKKVLQKEQDGIISRWITLALSTKTAQQRASINNWKLRFPKHPATQHVIPRLLQDLPKLTPPQQIALLLPLSSRFADRVKVIKNGFFAAAEKSASKVTIKVQDVNAANVLEAYQKAVDDGADFIVGPLEKNALEVLANSQPQLPVPTLALNHLQTAVTTGNLYQFSLSPEDEAVAVANRALLDGHNTALVIVPEGAFGKRISAAFKTALEEQGGKVVAQQSYGENFKTPISKALRRSMAVDMVFLLAFPNMAPEISPLIKSRLKNVPIYSTSHLYNGTPNPKENASLNGIRFADMPWILEPDEDARQWQRTLKKEMKKYRRLFALGIDAYTLVPLLQQLSQKEWQGQSGHLFVNSQGFIHRDQFSWGHFVGGKARLLDEEIVSE